MADENKTAELMLGIVQGLQGQLTKTELLLEEFERRVAKNEQRLEELAQDKEDELKDALVAVKAQRARWCKWGLEILKGLTLLAVGIMAAKLGITGE